MEFNRVFIDNDIISKIYEYLDSRSKVRFTHICSNTYNNYSMLARREILNVINKDYDIFFEFIRRYKYTVDELNEIGLIGVKTINIIWGSSLKGYYDLRYLFEIIYKGMDIKNEEIVKNIKDERILLMIKEIYNCKSFSRYETQLNVNKKPLLTSLHVSFTPQNKDDLFYIERNKFSRFQGSVWFIN